MIGGFLGRGVFTLSDGKLTTENPKGRAAVTLYEDDGKQLLKVDATLLPHQQRYRAELTPAK